MVEVAPSEVPSSPLLWDSLKVHIRTLTIDYLRKFRHDKNKLEAQILQCRVEAISLEKQCDWESHALKCEIALKLREAHIRLEGLLISQGQRHLVKNLMCKHIFNNTCSRYFFPKI